MEKVSFQEVAKKQQERKNKKAELSHTKQINAKAKAIAGKTQINTTLTAESLYTAGYGWSKKEFAEFWKLTEQNETYAEFNEEARELGKALIDTLLKNYEKKEKIEITVTAD